MNLGLLPHGWPSLSVQAITQAGSIIVPPAETCDYLPMSQVKEAILSEWSDVFQDEHLKPMAGPSMHTDLDSNAVPRKCFRARTMPFHWRDSVHSQLDSMMKKGVIERVPVGVQVSPATLTIMAAAAPSGRALQLQLQSCLISLFCKTLVTSLLLVKILCLGVMEG